MPWSDISGLLKGLLDRLFPDPAKQAEIAVAMAEIEIRAKEAEAKIEAARAEEFAQFIAATTPNADRVYVWTNSLIALVRPFLAIFSLVTWVYLPDRWREVLAAFGQLDLLGKFIIGSPLLIFVGGRDLMRMFVAIASARIGVNGNGSAGRALETLEKVVPPGAPPQPAKRPATKPVWTPPALPPVEGDTRLDVR